ncbi:MAG: hypothetical protein F6K48_01255 [Okeania sp. SIO3H1]|nr:hypothetical protein [Okeania sp. SIO1I7]NEN87620.1 hypothetical protein [Okeania sp. SIO3H1]NET26388.1 hypothetical protein [Okeania sp. SIO1I7]
MKKEEERRKKEEGIRKKEEGRRKKEEGKDDTGYFILVRYIKGILY